MPIRNSHRVGDHLMVDDESGYTHYASEMVERWDGAFVHHSNNETRHPQEFVKARNDPYPLKDVRPDNFSPVIDNTFEIEVGETTVPTVINGPAAHLFQPGIGKMIIESANELLVFEVQ
jgi:hypothetical protein